jgi:zinc transport system permease protein
MINVVLDALQFEFMRNALIAGILVSVACGIIGTYVVINRVVVISGGIAHAAYGGIGLGYFFSFDPVLGAIIFSLVSALIMALVERKTKQRADTIIGVMWAIGMAIGVILIDFTGGYKAELESYLFGSILTVPQQQIMIMLILVLMIGVIVNLLYKELLAISFDPVYAITRNLPVDGLYLLLISMIALTVVMVMQIVGLIMVIALLTIPSAIAGQFVQDIKQMMILASFLGIIFTITGLSLSYSFNLTSGATIILVAGIAYLVTLGIQYLREVR